MHLQETRSKQTEAEELSSSYFSSPFLQLGVRTSGFQVGLVAKEPNCQTKLFASFLKVLRVSGPGIHIWKCFQWNRCRTQHRNANLFLNFIQWEFIGICSNDLNLELFSVLLKILFKHLLLFHSHFNLWVILKESFLLFLSVSNPLITEVRIIQAETLELVDWTGVTPHNRQHKDKPQALGYHSSLLQLITTEMFWFFGRFSYIRVNAAKWKHVGQTRKTPATYQN